MSNGVMNYETFKQKVVENFKNYLPEMENADVIVRDVVKNNATFDGLTVTSKDSVISPTIYINHMYDVYKKLGDFEKTMKSFADSYMKHVSESMNFDFSKISTSEFIKSHVIMYLVNVEHNQKMLDGVPYVKFLDLAILFRVVVDSGSERVGSYILNTDMLVKNGLHIPDLFKLARKNTFEMFPTECSDMSVVIAGMIPGEDIQNVGNRMFIASNEARVNGAVAMLNNDFLETFSNKIGDDLYILPSSVHEVIILPAHENNDVDALKSMVNEVNCTTLDAVDFLSDNVYKYSRETKLVSIA